MAFHISDDSESAEDINLRFRLRAVVNKQNAVNYIGEKDDTTLPGFSADTVSDVQLHGDQHYCNRG